MEPRHPFSSDLTGLRVERKFLVPEGSFDVLPARLPGGWDEGYRVSTTYFDRPNLEFSRAALADARRCTKIRLRDYLDGSPYVWLEVKTREGGWTTKSRVRMLRKDVPSLLDGALPARGGDAEALAHVRQTARGELIPLGTVTVDRKAFEAEGLPLRITLDEGIQYLPMPGPFTALPTPHRDPRRVLEVKHTAALPDWCRAMLRELEATDYSKFHGLLDCLGLASAA